MRDEKQRESKIRDFNSLMNQTEYRTFWLSWDHNSIRYCYILTGSFSAQCSDNAINVFCSS